MMHVGCKVVLRKKMSCKKTYPINNVYIKAIFLKEPMALNLSSLLSK